MEAAERADELPPEDFEAMKALTSFAAQVEVERLPARVGIARIMAERFELRFPFGAAEAEFHRARQRSVQSGVARNSEQAARGVVDQVRQLLDLLIGEVAAGPEQQLALDLGHAGELAEENRSHGGGINEIRAGSQRPARVLDQNGVL